MTKVSASRRHKGVHHGLHAARGLGRPAGQLRLRAGHPLAPVRVELTIELARAFGLFAVAGVSVERPVPATDAELELVHDPRYIAGVRRQERQAGAGSTLC